MSGFQPELAVFTMLHYLLQQLPEKTLGIITSELSSATDLKIHHSETFSTQPMWFYTVQRHMQFLSGRDQVKALTWNSDKESSVLWHGGHCLNACDPPKFLCWNLIPDVIVLSSGVLREVIKSKGRTHMSGINALTKEAKEFSCPSHYVRTLQRCHLWSRVSPPQIPQLLAPWPWIFQPSEL